MFGRVGINDVTKTVVRYLREGCIGISFEFIRVAGYHLS